MKKIIKHLIFILISVLRNPIHLKIIIYDAFNKKFDIIENKVHIKVAMD